MPTLNDKTYAPILQVAQAISLCNNLFAEMELFIEGEVANYSISRGKFVFFDLKDENAEARLGCFMMAQQLSIPLEDGMRVLIQGRPGLYQKSGQFRISVTRVEAKGEGSVRRAFELLRLKLQDEGLFAQERKRLLPRFVRRVGIVSSTQAAGYGDFHKVAAARLPGIQFIVANVAVQGNDAEAEICAAFDTLNERYDLDAIVLIRGGGSMEDLHAFNSELVARAIVRSKAPVVVGVGHERDITIADYCADMRAATPSQAAQLLLPTLEEVVLRVQALTQQGRLDVEKRIQSKQDRVRHLVAGLAQSLLYRVQRYQATVDGRIRTIQALSPQQTLQRGYSITTGANGQPITLADAHSGTMVTTRLADGSFSSIVA